MRRLVISTYGLRILHWHITLKKLKDGSVIRRTDHK